MDCNKKVMELWPDGPRFVQAEHAPLGTDSVLLADFAGLSGAKRGIDLGCASGAVALLLLQRSQRLHMTGLELLPQAAEEARENMAANGLTERCAVITGDIRRHRELFRAGSFDLAVANPPYFPVGSGPLPPDPARAAARGETDCRLEELCDAAAYLLRTGGSFTLVHRPERLSEVFCAMSARAIEPKRLRLVCARPGAAPSLVLIEGRRGGKPGLKIEAPLLLQNADGSETGELKKIYHKD